MINEFRGKYYFLSNFYNRKIKYKDLTFENNEAAFHSEKDLTKRKEFCNLNPSEAKKLGRRVKLREDWGKVKDQIMYKIIFIKFTQHEDLKQKLIDTGDEELIEGNTWNDTYWGTCRGNGKNKLGEILMRVREELR